MPPLKTDGLWDCQIEAIRNLEQSFAADRPRALIQMATGSGKTFTAVSFIYRLIKHAKARRVLFLVDRSNLGRQTRNEFAQHVTPDDGRKFTELYNVQRMTSNALDPVSRVCICTIQRLYSMLKGEELDPELEEHSDFENGLIGATPKDVAYSPAIPIETFDFIVTDECHRSIYNLWRQVLEYFDAHIIGLTATPSAQTIGFFNQNLVMEYGHERAVADGVNVGYEVYRIKTEITENGSTVEAGNYVDRRDKLTREERWDQLDDDFSYARNELDRSVVSESQIRTVLRTFRDNLATEIFPGRTELPKTLIFAKDDSHAEDIVRIAREEFGRGNDFCKKITYRTTGDKPENLIASFRNSYNPRIAVSVDMISTGTDIRPIECLLFMRDIRSRGYFEQMKGRGTRTIKPSDLQAVTPDAGHKTHFVIVDAVGVCESKKQDTHTLERKKYVSFEKLIQSIAMGVRDEDTLTTLAGRLARLNQEIAPTEREELEDLANGRDLSAIVNTILDAIDPDKQSEAARQRFETDDPTPEQVTEAAAEIALAACAPFDSPDFRNRLVAIKRRSEQVIDKVSQDRLILSGYDAEARERAQALVRSFRDFIEQNKDQITALQILYNVPYGQRHLTYEAVKELAESIQKPPYGLTTDLLWQAYQQLERDKVRGSGPQRLLTNIISLVRFALGQEQVLEPYPETVEHRFEQWLQAQQKQGRTFTQEQLDWLRLIKDHIATSLTIDMDDFEYAPFHEKGGPVKVWQVFGDNLNSILADLNKALAA
jgi:type I restriction enzyme R subunit